MSDERTILPPSPQAELDELVRLLAVEAEPCRAKSIGPDGSTIKLPDEVYRALRDVAEALSQGPAITIAPHDTMLTTQEAADLLNLSRPTLVRMLDDGEIPHGKRGRHRRVLLRNVLAYQERSRTDVQVVAGAERG